MSVSSASVSSIDFLSSLRYCICNNFKQCAFSLKGHGNERKTVGALEQNCEAHKQ